uniref:Uncharacterized protein n=1 Tax=Rhizophora mucronata TaxID=61149 RepID=A0A2P2QQY2_RHIMU
MNKLQTWFPCFQQAKTHMQKGIAHHNGDLAWALT